MDTADEFDVRVERLPAGPVVVAVTGELDLAGVGRFEEAMSVARTADHVVVDLTPCTFLDSSGVRVLANSARETSERGAKLELVASDPAVLRVLEITGVDTIAPVHASLDAAL